MNGVKMEDAPQIKPDPADYAEPSLMDEDEFEDTGELMIPAAQNEMEAWLVKLPKWLWEAWANISEDEEMQIGTLRYYHDKHPDGSDKIRIKLKDIPGHTKVPKMYNVKVTKSDYNNTIVFSEKDQPGFKAGSWNRNRLQRRQDIKPDPYKVNKKPYKSSIPKQTALAGYIKNEANVTAVENEEYHRLNKARFTEMFQPKRTTTFAPNVENQMRSDLGTSAAFANFVSTAKKPSKKRQQEKAVRISQEDLLDQLHQCFKEFRYWSLRALRLRLNQPEAYIKSSLEKIATLIRAGPFAMNYKLTDEYERINMEAGGVKEEAAEEDGVSDEDMKDEDGDEGMDDFEDVTMS